MTTPEVVLRAMNYGTTVDGVTRVTAALDPGEVAARTGLTLDTLRYWSSNLCISALLRCGVDPQDMHGNARG